MIIVIINVTVIDFLFAQFVYPGALPLTILTFLTQVRA